MVIFLNGERKVFESPCTLSELLQQFELKPHGVVVERNRSIVRAEDLDRISIQNEDVIEIVRFVGGG
jgi:thiamine biosynthesis protein ThiS